ncbi:enoyl-CoA delta isomerase 2-like [Daphnia carinata]|uniref:enoyl-CoA delta isomerase 2-like n=1 Tax=Daphnia carinata TaxID=120202 RepID=UPI00257B86AD|nr:enoyl-CoA delta isomerase 2-like [Daphnia carinata]
MMATPNQENQTVQYPGLNVKIEEKLMVLQLNAPKRKNALTPSMYAGITSALQEAEKSPHISIVAITGTGDFYSSGNDFGVLLGKVSDLSSTEADAQKGLTMVQNFVDTLIDFPKPIVAVLNGPAVGIAVTTLALMDAVYASEKVWLHTPFTQLGLCPEGCSSLTFPRIMGSLKASEVLLFGQKMTAVEAEKTGLITKVFPAAEAEAIIWSKLKEISQLPSKSMIHGKQLCRNIDRELLHKVNAAECAKLAECQNSEETMEAMLRWFTRRSKL